MDPGGSTQFTMIKITSWNLVFGFLFQAYGQCHRPPNALYWAAPMLFDIGLSSDDAYLCNSIVRSIIVQPLCWAHVPLANLVIIWYIYCIYWKIDFLGVKTDCKWISIGGMKNGSSDQCIIIFAYVPSTAVRRGDEIRRFGIKVVHTESKPVISDNVVMAVPSMSKWRPQAGCGVLICDLLMEQGHPLSASTPTVPSVPLPVSQSFDKGGGTATRKPLPHLPSWSWAPEQWIIRDALLLLLWLCMAWHSSCSNFSECAALSGIAPENWLRRRTALSKFPGNHQHECSPFHFPFKISIRRARRWKLEARTLSKGTCWESTFENGSKIGGREGGQSRSSFKPLSLLPMITGRRRRRRGTKLSKF